MGCYSPWQAMTVKYTEIGILSKITVRVILLLFLSNVQMQRKCFIFHDTVSYYCYFWTGLLSSVSEPGEHILNVGLVNDVIVKCINFYLPLKSDIDSENGT